MIVSPRKIFLNPGESHEIHVLGGDKPYTLVPESGTIENVGDDKYKYTAPTVAGIYQIKVTDKTGSSLKIDVQVSHALWVSPQITYLERNATKTFKLAGGVGKDDKIILRALRGDLPLHPENRSFVYTAPDETGPDTIIVTDVNGSEVKVNIEISSDYFFITPSSAMLLREENRLFRLVGGVGDDFNWTTLLGDTGTDDTDEKYINYFAPGQTGSDTLTAIDNSNKKVNWGMHLTQVATIYSMDLSQVHTPDLLIHARGVRKLFV